MEKIDVNGWNYDQADRMIGQFKESYRWARHIDWAAKRMWEAKGKTFSLSLCGMLARGSRFNVPEWFAANDPSILNQPSTKLWLEGRHGPLIVRSSSKNEDWHDRRSGIGRSEWCMADRLPKLLEERFRHKEQCVVQKYVWGCGCVIDIGYSELLSRNVVRVARGHINYVAGNKTNYTSATWDHEALTAIYDAEAITQLTGYQMGFANGYNPFWELVRELIGLFNKTHWDFGIQLEVIVDPLNQEWHLVQIRPSPGKIQGMKEKPELVGKLVSTTGKVNKVGVVEGSVVYVDSKTMERQGMSDAFNDAIDAALLGQGKVEPALAGKIVHWNTEQLYQYKSEPVLPVLAASLLGATAQTSKEFLFGNSAHATYVEYKKKRKKHYERAILAGLQMGQVGEEFDRLVSYNLGDEKRVRLVSDGLVGQIFLL